MLFIINLMKFRPLVINYQHEALHYQEEQLRSHFFHIPYSGETNAFHVGVNVTYIQRSVPTSFVTNVSRRPLRDQNINYISSEFSSSNILKAKADINFITTEDVPHEQFCFNKENNGCHLCDFIQDKNVALLTLQHSYHFQANEKLKEILAPDSVSALITQQQGRRKRNNRHSVTEFTFLYMSHCKLFLPENFIGCIIADESTRTSDSNKYDDWLSKRKEIWALQRELIKSKRLARKQRPWWYYYDQPKNPMYIELVSSNLTGLQSDMKLPLMDSANATVSTTDFTTTRKPFLPWIESIVPSTRVTKEHQEQEYLTSMLPLDGKLQNGPEDFLFFQSNPCGEEKSSCLYNSCTTNAGSTHYIKEIIEDVALPSSKEFKMRIKMISDVAASLSIPSAVAMAFLVIPQKRMRKPNTCHLMQNLGTNFLTSKRFSEIIGIKLTPESSSHSYRAFMQLPHKHQLKGVKLNLYKSGDDSLSMKNFCMKPSVSIDDNQTLSQNFFEKDCSTNEKMMFRKDLGLSGLAKDCNRERELTSDVKLQLMTGCFMQQIHVPCAHYGFLTGDVVDASVYHFRYRHVFLRQNEELSDNYMFHLAFHLQALRCVCSSLLLPSTSPRRSSTTKKVAFPIDRWLPKFLLKNRRNLESKAQILPASLALDSAGTLTDKKVNMTSECLLTGQPREFNQIFKIHRPTDWSLNTFENWINAKIPELISSTHNTLALRSELTHLMTKAHELVFGREENSVFCDGRTYHNDVKGLDVKAMRLPMADQGRSFDKTRLNDIVRDKKRKPRQEPECCAKLQKGDFEHEESSSKVAEKKRRKSCLDRENFAQVVGESDIRVTTTDGLKGVALTDDNVRKTAPLNIDKTKLPITQTYAAFQNGTTDGFFSDISEDYKILLSRDGIALESKVTPMTDPLTKDPAVPPLCNLEESSNRIDCNSDNSGLVTSVQVLNRNASQNMMEDFFKLMGRSRREKGNEYHDYENVVHGTKDIPLDNLISHRPVSTNKSASNKSKHGGFALSQTANTTHASSIHNPRTTISVLCSGHFLENFSETVASLGSGQWSRTSNESTKSGSCIVMCDSPVIDFAGVDIELPDSSGIICVRLSQLVNSQNNLVKSFTKRILYLASIGRYSRIWIYIVCDADITRSLSMDLFLLQNTLVMKQNCNCPCEKIAVYLTSLPALPSCIAVLLLEHSSIHDSCDKNKPEELLGQLGSSRRKIQERAIFLIALIPSYTALDALSCIHSVCLENGDTNATPGPLRLEQAFTDFLLDAAAVANGDDAICRVKLMESAKMIEKSLLDLSKAMKWKLVKEYNSQAGK